MIKLLCYKGGEEESYRLFLKNAIKHDVVTTKIVTVGQFSKKYYCSWPINLDIALNNQESSNNIVLYKYKNNINLQPLTSLLAVGLLEDDDTSLLDDLKVYTYKYYEGFKLIFIAAHTTKEAIEILKDHLNKRIIEQNLDQLSNVRIETIPKIFKTVDL